jgi:hypothetical protein
VVVAEQLVGAVYEVDVHGRWYFGDKGRGTRDEGLGTRETGTRD